MTPGVPPLCRGRREGVAGHSQAVQTNGVPAEAAVTGGQYVSSPTYWACTAYALSFDYHQNGP